MTIDPRSGARIDLWPKVGDQWAGGWVASVDRERCYATIEGSDRKRYFDPKTGKTR